MRNKTYSTLFIAAILVAWINQLQAQSLYYEADYQSLVSDQRSIKPGDILTVLIYESASASSSNTVDLSKSVGIGLSASDGSNSVSAGLGVDNDFNGGGRKSRVEKLVASVAVTVQGMTPSGGIIISGKQTIEYNEEEQTISVEGDIRAEDITPDNTVLSSRIANSKIQVIGEGLLTNHSKPGLLTRFISWLF